VGAAALTFALLAGVVRAQEPEPEVALARLAAREPTIDQVRAWALAAAHLAGDPEAGWARRSRWAGALPRLSLRARRGTGIDRDGSSASGWVDSSFDVDTWIEARAEWDLDRLLFDERELRAAEVARRRRLVAADLVRRVTRTYFERRRLQAAALLDPPDDPGGAARLHIRIAELTAHLDAVTGGCFASGRMDRGCRGKSARAHGSPSRSP
jgi:hypothetical protein